MSFRVVVYDSAVDDMDEAYSYVAKHAPQTALSWLLRFRTAIGELATTALIYAPADEAGIAKLPLRQMLFGKRPYVFRVIFLIDGTEVQVFRVLRGQRRRLSKKRLGEARKTRPPEDTSNPD